MHRKTAGEFQNIENCMLNFKFELYRIFVDSKSYTRLILLKIACFYRSILAYIKNPPGISLGDMGFNLCVVSLCYATSGNPIAPPIK